MNPKKHSKWLFQIALAINIGLALSFLGLAIIAAQQGLFWSADFTVFYTGGALVRDGLGKQLYNLELQEQYQQAILAGRSFQDGLLPYNNPPHNALIFAILTLLPLSAAYAIQVILQLILLAGLMITLWRFSQKWSRQERILLITGVLAFYPLLSSIMLGAFSLLILLCFLLWVEALKAQRDVKAGLWLLPASLKPQTAVLPALTLLFGRRWRSITAGAVGGIALITLTAILLGPGIWLDFVKALQLSSSFFGEYSIYPSTMYNLKGTLTIWMGNQAGSLINAISLIGFIFSIGVTWWLWRGPWKVEHSDFELRMATTLTLSVLLGLHVHPQDGLLLVAPAVLFYEYLRQNKLPRRAYGIFLWLCPLVFLLGEFTVQDRLGIRLPVIAIIISLAWQLKTFWDQR
jgi:hypothetical protein